jgi:hypothetical protein
MRDVDSDCEVDKEVENDCSYEDEGERMGGKQGEEE